MSEEVLDVANSLVAPDNEEFADQYGSPPPVEVRWDPSGAGVEGIRTFHVWPQ